MRTARLLGVCLCAWLARSPRNADACTDELPAPFVDIAPIPNMGTVAPTNTRIWIPAPTDPGQLHVTANGTEVAFDTTGIDVAGEYGVMFILIPQAPLPAGATVVVSQGTETLTKFTVGTAPDESAPPPPVIEHIDIDAGYFGAFYCVDDSRVAIRAAYDADLLLVDEQRGTELPTKALGLSTPPDPFATAIGLSEGEHDLRLLAVDQAGNATAVAVPQVTMPAEPSGCSTTHPTGALWMLAPLGLVARRRVRRRRRQSERAQRKPTCENRRDGS